jgi:hypothetical protein
MDLFKGHGPSTISSKQDTYPLAFSHVMHHQPGILEMFLAMTFRPTDSHCIHIDVSTNEKTRDVIEQLYFCLRPDSEAVA